MKVDKENLDLVSNLVRNSETILFITGAGVSTESGLPTYRGIGGLYEGNATEDAVAIEEALSGAMFRRRPEITWKYLWEIAEATRGARPNRAHEVIGKWVKEKPDSWILTQNVDGLHAEAGEHHLIEIHGRAGRIFCPNCGTEEKGEELLFRSGRVEKPAAPSCGECESVMRPEVVLFGELLPKEALRQMEALQHAGIDLVMSIGTSSQFPYITAPVELASQSGIPCVEINPEETSVSRKCDFRLRAGCGEVLAALDQLV